MVSHKVCIQTNGRISLDRRAFFKTAALTGVAAALTAVPLLTYVIAPALKKGSGKWIDFGPLDRLDAGSIEMLSYEFMVKDGWLVLPQRGFVCAKEDGPENITVVETDQRIKKRGGRIVG